MAKEIWGLSWWVSPNTKCCNSWVSSAWCINSLAGTSGIIYLMLKWWNGESQSELRYLSVLLSLWKRTALPLSQQPEILLETALKNQISWLLYMQELPVSFSDIILLKRKIAGFLFQVLRFLVIFQKDQIFLSPETLGTAIFGRCIQGVITCGCTKRIRGLGSQERINYDSSEWKSGRNMTVLLNYTKIRWKK